MTIFYDNWCPKCSKFSSFIQKLDWLKLIQIKQLRNELHIDSYPTINLEMARRQMASFDIKWNYGYTTLYLIFIRLPVFWIIIPLLFILKISGLGQFLYMQLALKREIIPIHCDENSCGL
jgi:predicted DCC family thiol-disulfide oxidoreductase YuxK